MNKLWLIGVLAGFLAALAVAAPTDSWELGRIVDVRKDVNTKTLYWMVNTPVTEDATTYTISVHVKNRILTGKYQLDHPQGPPPETWVQDFVVKTQVDGDNLYLRPPAGNDFKLKIVKRKSAAMMRPVTVQELAGAGAGQPANAIESTTGFIPPTKETPAATPPAASVPASVPAAPVQASGMISVRSTPYLADVYVDGQDMGYTPAKLSLPPGKHTVRFEKEGYKSWSKEITLTAGSELLVDAALERK